MDKIINPLYFRINASLTSETPKIMFTFFRGFHFTIQYKPNKNTNDFHLKHETSGTYLPLFEENKDDMVGLMEELKSPMLYLLQFHLYRKDRIINLGKLRKRKQLFLPLDETKYGEALFLKKRKGELKLIDDLPVEQMLEEMRCSCCIQGATNNLFSVRTSNYLHRYAIARTSPSSKSFYVLRDVNQELFSKDLFVALLTIARKRQMQSLISFLEKLSSGEVANAIEEFVSTHSLTPVS